MKYPNLLHAATLVAVLGAGGALGQTKPAPAATDPSPVVTDVGPAPAEDRASTGAIVLENSLVQAQRANAFERSASRDGVASVGRGVLRATRRAQREQLRAELEQARLNESLELQRRGPGSLDQK